MCFFLSAYFKIKLYVNLVLIIVLQELTGSYHGLRIDESFYASWQYVL